MAHTMHYKREPDGNALCGVDTVRGYFVFKTREWLLVSCRNCLRNRPVDVPEVREEGGSQ